MVVPMSSSISCRELSLSSRGSRLEQLLGGSALPHFDLVERGHHPRDAVERYIHERFLSAYGANVAEFMPWLLTLRCAGSLSAVVGMRPAGSGPLFVEHYFDEPVERLLAERSGRPVERYELLEIGNLVSTWRGSSQLLMVMLPLLASALGYRWLVFTATAEVAKLIGRLHFELVPLCRADGDRLGERRATWGSYYDNTPMVMAGYLPDALQQLAAQRLPTAVARAFTPQLVDIVQGRQTNAASIATADTSVLTA